MTIEYKDFRSSTCGRSTSIATESPNSDAAYGVRPQGRLPPDWKAPIFGEVNKGYFESLMRTMNTDNSIQSSRRASVYQSMS